MPTACTKRAAEAYFFPRLGLMCTDALHLSSAFSFCTTFAASHSASGSCNDAGVTTASKKTTTTTKSSCSPLRPRSTTASIADDVDEAVDEFFCLCYEI